MTRELTKLLQASANHGWTAETTRGGHMRLRHSEAKTLVIASATPSDRRAIANIQADMRRALRSGRD